MLMPTTAAGAQVVTVTGEAMVQTSGRPMPAPRGVVHGRGVAMQLLPRGVESGLLVRGHPAPSSPAPSVRMVSAASR